MTRQRLFLIGGAVAAVLLIVGVALYVMGGGTNTPPGQGVFARMQSGISRVAGSQTPQQMAEAPEFAFRRLEIDTSKAQPQACLVFTRKLETAASTHYEDYLTIDPETRIVVRPLDQRLCIAGLDFNKTYTVTLKKGLPAASGEKLAAEETVPVELRDKPALVRFSSGIILPRDNTDGVPVTTVNIDRLKLKIVRVGDRLLSQIESGVVDQTTLYKWDEEQLEKNQGAVVWSGAMDVANIKNQSVVTLIPIANVLKGRKPGAYVLIAHDANDKVSDDDYSTQFAAQWVIDSDTAITAFQGADGLTVFTRSYASAKPIKAVTVKLVARNNNVLSKQTTDSDGRADFDGNLFNATGGDEPVAVMAYTEDGDFSFLDLRRPAFDLTDRGVGGRSAPGPIDAFLYTERGVYRPGETVHASALLRDRVGAAVTAPLTLIATRPDGMEVARTTVTGASLAAGTAVWDVSLNATAPHGRWQIAAYIDPKAKPVGRVQFDVADFVPQKLKVTLDAQQKSLSPNADINIKATARFLYGAPASGLTGEADARITADPNPFPKYAQYQFGRMDDAFSDTQMNLVVPPTDAAGVTNITGNVGDVAETTLPLKMTVKVAIHEPGGRTTGKSIDIPLHTTALNIGIRPEFDGGAVPQNAKAGFEVIALNNDGKRVALSGLTYTWVREVTDYQWYQENGSWKYQSTTRDRLISSGALDIGTGNPAKLSQSMPWGTYRLTVNDPKSGAAASYRFYSGWAASASGDRPDRIPVAADKPAYAPGDTAHISIKPAADGRALVVVAGDKVFSSQLIDAPKDGTSVDITVDADWGPGAYVLVTDYRPLNQATGREPVRAIGVAWLGIDNSPRTITPVIGGPDKVRPRQRINIPVTLNGLGNGEQAYLTLAAVDEGILQLTDYKTPDPVKYYFGKRRLGVGMHDDYGRLIKPEKAPIGSLREGGDGFAGRPLSVVPTRTVALFSGLVKVGADGKANVPLDIPDFNGELRLMAVAVTDKKIGRAERALTVRDAVVADIVLPRFLAPGDTSNAALNINNVEGAPGQYTATVTSAGPVGLEGGAAQTIVTRDLKLGQRVLVPVALSGKGLGIATIRLKLTGPKGFSVTRAWPIEVRAPQLDVARESTAVLGPGQSYTAGAALVAGLVPSTVVTALNVSSSHGYNDVPGLLRWLDKYPYGCLEQTTSAAMPLLYFNDMAKLAGLEQNEKLHARVQNAVDSVLDMQNYSGDFGMWGPGSTAEPWVSVFALDFLYQAKAKNYVVPNEGLKRGGNWLAQIAASSSYDDATRAYAFYVLSRAGQVNLSDLRYFSDTRGAEWNTAISGALTGAAAALAGDRSRANYGFTRAKQIALAAAPATYSTDDYGSLVRDLAGTTALTIEAGNPQLVPALMERTGDVDMRINATTTQEKAWILRAAYELSKERGPVKVTVDGKPAVAKGGTVHLAPKLAALTGGITLKNVGDANVWRSVSVQGTPEVPLPATAHGLRMTKTIWTRDGQPVDLANVKQNDRMVIVISGQMSDNLYRQMAVLDLLPAGFEVENAIQGDDAKLYPWLGDLTNLTMSDARDDRYVAAFNIGSRYHPRPNAKKPPPPPPSFHIAYVVRATTAGSYVMPAGVVEDMYAPAILARTEMKRVNIAQGE